ncbi:MAG TPA: LysR family transcriptional regulator substrate-binding protein, partial [Archangium sp.]
LDLVLAALPGQADGVHTRALPPMPMVFAGKRTLHKQRKYTLEQLAQGELLTFQRGSQPHAALLELLRGAGIEAPRVHTLSSISAMVRLVAGGFGVATLPHAALERLAAAEGLRPLPCETELVPLPLHASWRVDPTSNALEAIVDSAVAFAGSGASPPAPHRKKR